MNALENWFCATGFWRSLTRNLLLPRMLDGSDLGDSVLEVGAGPGAATAALLERFPRVTSLEYRETFAARLAREHPNACVVIGDAAILPFASASFSCVVSVLTLHHLQSRELQDQALHEIVRVLRPGGVFLAFEINDGWLQRFIHVRSTFVPVVASAANARLNAAGFARASVDFLPGGFLVRARIAGP
jgi:ubiquinone/menaquinone biosynthesis C-methylase UbiE